MGYITRFEPMTFVFVSNSLFTSQKCFCDRLPFATKNVCTLNVDVQSHLLNEMEWLQLKPACESLFFCLLSFSNFFSHFNFAHNITIMIASLVFICIHKFISQIFEIEILFSLEKVQIKHE